MRRERGIGVRIGVLGDGGSEDKDSWMVRNELGSLELGAWDDGELTHWALLAIDDGGYVYVRFDDEHFGGCSGSIAGWM